LEDDKMLTWKEVVNDDAVRTYIKKADESLVALGYTEHSYAHVGRVAHMAAELLSALGYEEREVELVKIAGFMHDIGNLVNRDAHSQRGAVMAFGILEEMGMEPTEIAKIVTAIGNHDEGVGVPVSPIAAALILADKSDVRRSRVRNTDPHSFDIHDRVNFSVYESSLKVNAEEKAVLLELKIDTEIGSIMDYFSIFLGRMDMCKKAAKALGLRFALTINQQSFI
jgi:metal-dependent HD superfamily phosphatase/phosphodiesterase